MKRLISNEDIFKGEKKTDIIERLKNLQTDRAWLDLVKVLQHNKASVEADMFNEEVEPEKIQELRLRRSYLEQMIELPQWLIDKLSGDNAGEENFDPYDEPIA